MAEEIATVEEAETLAAQVARVEAKVDAILATMQSINEHVSVVGEVIEDLQDSPIGNMLFGMMGGE